MVGLTIPAAEAALATLLQGLVPASFTSMTAGGPRRLPESGGIHVYLPRTDEVTASGRGSAVGERYNVRVVIEADAKHNEDLGDSLQLLAVKNRAWAAALAVDQAIASQGAGLIDPARPGLAVFCEFRVQSREGGFIGNVWLGRVSAVAACSRLAL